MMDKLTCLQVLCHYLAAEYFHCYLNQMPKPLSYRSNILRIETNWEYWLNYLDDLLVKLNERFDTLSYKPFLNTSFYKRVYTYCCCMCLCEAKATVQRNWAAFFDWFGLLNWVWGSNWCYSIKGSVFLVLFMQGDRESWIF